MKTKKIVLFICVLYATFHTTANAFTEKEKNNSSSENALFRMYSASNTIDVSKDIANATFLELDFTVLNRLVEQRNETLTLSFPLSQTENITLNLHQAKVTSDNFILSTDKKESVKYTPGVYYQGTVANEKKSIAGISLFNNNVMGVFTINGENYVLGLWEEKTNINKNIYILFKEADVKHPQEFKCGTDDALQFFEKSKSGGGNPDVQTTNCIKIYFECDYQMYLDKGTVNDVTNYVTGFFNIVQLLYTSESISTEISQIYVWTTTDPYVSNATSSDYLNDFQATRTTFNGNIAHLLTTRPLSIGGLAYLDIICTPTSAYGFDNIENSYQPYPTYSNTILIVTHELGHNFGSEHTHWCGWPGGAIDDCYATEGGCAGGANPGTNGGTIMSYCHLAGGTSLANGFGTLPGNTIRAAYAAATCLTPCNSPPEAAFTASTPVGCSLPQTIAFTDESSFGTNAWAWDINNDGTIDYTTQNPSHTYTVAGSYTVKLIATNANGSDTIIKVGFVSVGTVPAGITTAITTGTDTFCEGTPVTFTATPINGGTTPTYQWYVDGNSISGATSATFNSNTLTGNPVVTCQITSSADCASPATATSTGIPLTITPSAVPQVTVSILSGDETICVGESVSFYITSVNGGGSPIYQWLVGTTPVATGSTFTSSTLANGDLVKCTLTSNVTCASPATVTSAAITMIVNPIVTPTATISILSGNLPACPGSNVTFAASSTNGGGNPSYQWQINGNNTHVGVNYTPINPQAGDVVSCIVTSSANCLSIDSATSNTINITLIDPIVPTLSAATMALGATICYGDTTTVLIATPVNGGSTPTYQWMLNGFAVPGADSVAYEPATIIDGDVYSCVLTSSGTCPQTVESNDVTMTVTPIPSIIFVSDISVCAGEIPENVLTSNPAGAYYTWTNSNTAIGLAANGTGNVSAFTSSNAGATAITSTVTVTPSIDGCDGASETYTITINSTPEISVSGATLTATNGSGYQWYLDGIPVPNANNQSYTATENGQYTVIIDGVDCPSIAVMMTAASINDISNLLSFNLYPNPSNGSFSLSFFAAEKDTYSIKLVNALGASVYEKQLIGVSGNHLEFINLTDVAKGVYLLHFSSAKTDVLKKLVIE